MKRHYTILTAAMFAAISIGVVASQTGQVQSQIPKKANSPALPSSGELTLDVTGDGIETVIVAKKLPFFVSAPKGAALYFWQIPNGAKGVENNHTVFVESIAKGTHQFKVKAFYINWDAKKTDEKIGVVTVVVGDIQPAPPPPPPTPIDPLVKSIQAAYDSETDPKKLEHKSALAALYRQGAEFARKTDVATWGQLFSVLSQAAKTLGVGGKLPSVQKAIQAELTIHLPTERQRPLDDTGRTTAAETFARVAAALEGVK
jgi:hypothetical protein